MPEQEAEQCEGQAQDKPSKTSILESIRFRSVSFARNVPRNMRAIAFRNKELHEERDTLNAYAVFTSTAYASRVCEALNGHVFQDQHLRADMADGSSKVYCSPPLSHINKYSHTFIHIYAHTHIHTFYYVTQTAIPEKVRVCG